MNKEEFENKRPYLYHLTDRRNLKNISKYGILKSTTTLVNSSDLENKIEFLQTKRNSHEVLNIQGTEIHIRDQNPISEIVLRRSLEPNCSYEEYLMILNSHVFFWPTKIRLERHFKRYIDEKPIILRIKTQDLFNLNKNPKFSRLNSGATRCSSHWGGNAPERGKKTFLLAYQYEKPIPSVAEVTFENECHLPDTIYISGKPNGRFESIKL